MYADNISFAMCSLLFKVPPAVPLCRYTQVYTFSTNIFLTSVHVQLYPVIDKIYKKDYIYQVARPLSFFKIV